MYASSVIPIVARPWLIAVAKQPPQVTHAWEQPKGGVFCLSGLRDYLSGMSQSVMAAERPALLAGLLMLLILFPAGGADTLQT